MKESLLKFMLMMAAILAGTTQLSAALTAEEVASKAAAVVSDTKGVSAAFTITSAGKTTSGTVKTLGSKFTVQLPEVKTWYNGKALYTYNPRTAETTVTTPTAQELMESNPLLYIKGGAAFSYSFSPVKRNGKYVIVIKPRKSGTGINKLTVTVNATTFKPEKIAVETSGGNTVVEVTSLTTAAGCASSEFEYPKSKYPKVEIVDLR